MDERPTEEVQTGQNIVPSKGLANCVDPFGHCYAGDAGISLSNRFMKQYGWVMDHEHCRKKVSSENVEPLDLYALTQSYKHECGMELMKSLLRSGAASPEDFYDTGELGGDDTLPKDINTLHKVITEEAAQFGKVVTGLGGNMSNFEEAVKNGKVDEYINGLVSAAVAAQQKPAQNNEEVK